MYLSRLELDLKRRDTMRALASPSVFHGAVEAACHAQDAERQLSLFPDLPTDSQTSLFEAKGRTLWRIDTLRGKTYLLILSRERPDLSRAVEQFGTGAAWETKNYDILLNSVRKGERFRFRLTANPTVSRPSPRGTDVQKPRGTVYAHITTEYQRLWLLQTSERRGFHLNGDSFDVTESRWRDFRKGTERKQRVTLLSVTYEGMLEVTDAEKFRETLAAGLGRGKAYGMGLLTVMRTGARQTFSPHTRG